LKSWGELGPFESNGAKKKEKKPKKPKKKQND
jgi:hypothetical protein